MAVSLAYEVSGPRNGDPIPPVVVLLGSLGSDLSMWDPQATALSDEFRVIAVDQRGHGRSPSPAGPYSIRGLSEDVLAILDTLAVDAAHIIGLSMGGAIAQWLAANASHRVLSLSLLCTAAKFGEPQGWIERAAAARADGTESLADAVVARWFTEDLATRDPEFVRRYREMVAATPDEGYAACCDALADWDFAADLPRISAPALIIAGAEDPSTPPSVMQILADGITGSRFEVLSPAAHVANLEQPGKVTALLREHILGAHHSRGRAGCEEDSAI